MSSESVQAVRPEPESYADFLERHVAQASACGFLPGVVMETHRLKPALLSAFIWVSGRFQFASLIAIIRIGLAHSGGRLGPCEILNLQPARLWIEAKAAVTQVRSKQKAFNRAKKKGVREWRTPLSKKNYRITSSSSVTSM